MFNSSPIMPGIPLVESPLFKTLVDKSGLSETEIAVATSLNERGYAVIEFPDPEIDQRIERIKRRLEKHFGIDPTDPQTIAAVPDRRIQDAWKADEDVKAIAINEKIIDLLGKLYQRRPIPFQTLNFPVGTQQNPHSDAVHFSSQPERFMCGVWLAFEDIHPDAGPLVYYPGSHKWPIVTNSMIGRRGWKSRSASAQTPFETAWRAMVDASGVELETFIARKGQALIWASNLLHGGGAQNNLQKTRWSQVTHYYFDDCLYYTPAFSDEALGLLDLRAITNIVTGEIQPNKVLGEELASRGAVLKSTSKRGWMGKLFGSHDPSDREQKIPADFDGREYQRLNPDVAAAGVDPATHYMLHGREEGRVYRSF